MDNVRIPGENGHEYALRVIRNAIIHMELEPGSRVDINELAEELGVSRTPVREALQDLALSGIVEIVPQSGSRVALVDYDVVEEAVFVRMTLECAMARRLCEMSPAPDFLNMQTNIIMQENSVLNGAIDQYKELDNQFHYLLFENAGCARTYHMYIGMMIHFDRIREMNVRTLENNTNIQEHKYILEAIRRRDADAACAYIKLHLQHYKQDKNIIMKKFAKYMKSEN